MSDPHDPPQSALDALTAMRARRSVRRFDSKRPVPESLVLECIDAARHAPSSCNLQTWDFIWVTDADLRKQLSEQTKSVLIAPVTLFVAYDRELAKEGLANVQSASAAIENLLLAATARGLASLWVNALGDRRIVRRLLQVPDDYEVLALVCLGYPLDADPPPMPERRPLDEIVHRNAYQGRGSLPKSPDPDDWSLGDLATYFKRKLQSGTRYNKPLTAFCDPVLNAIESFLPPKAPGQRFLDALPGTALFTELLRDRRPDASFSVAELSAECHFFANRRCGGRVGLVPFPAAREPEILAACAPPGTKVQLLRESGGLVVMPRILPHPDLDRGAFDVITVLFRLEGIPSAHREELLKELAGRLLPTGRLIVAHVSRRSWHLPAYALRRRMGRSSVEVAPAPEPNIIGPFEAISPGAVRRMVGRCGLEVEREARLLPLPDVHALGAVEQRVTGAMSWLLRVAKFLAGVASPFQGLLKPFARVRVLCLKRCAGPSSS